MKQAGKKTGRLAFGHKMPTPSYTGGLDWGRIREQYHARLEEEYERGVRNPDTIAHHEWRQMDAAEKKEAERKLIEKAVKPKSPSRVYQRGSGPTGRKKGQLFQKYDIDEVVRLYVEENMAPIDIVTKMQGPSYETVINYLKKRDVFDKDRHRKQPKGAKGPVRNKFCPKCGCDLDLPENSRERFKRMPDGSQRTNGRECVPCCRERNRSHRENSNGE